MVTGQVRWLCSTHQKLPRVTVMSDELHGGASSMLGFEESDMMLRYINDLRHLQQKFVETRTDPPRTMTKWDPTYNIPRMSSILREDA